MKKLKKMAAQGDVMLINLDAYSAADRERMGFGKCDEVEKPKDGYHIVTHSETGHNHVVMERSAQMLIDKTNAFIAELDVKEPCEVKHLRSFDTHESIGLDKGKVGIKRQREYTPQGWRRAQD